METIRFVVEGRLIARTCVFCRRLDARDFSLTPKTTLAGCAVLSFDIPRKVRADGSPDADLFAFFLIDERDLDRFPVGETVLLAGFL